MRALVGGPQRPRRYVVVPAREAVWTIDALRKASVCAVVADDKGDVTIEVRGDIGTALATSTAAVLSHAEALERCARSLDEGGGDLRDDGVTKAP